MSQLAFSSFYNLTWLVDVLWIVFITKQLSLVNVIAEIYFMLANFVLICIFILLIFFSSNVNNLNNVMSFPRNDDGMMTPPHVSTRCLAGRGWPEDMVTTLQILRRRYDNATPLSHSTCGPAMSFKYFLATTPESKHYKYLPLY